ncbi:hypothetical protein Tco_0962968, partial [Tanacetum coccineum]
FTESNIDDHDREGGLVVVLWFKSRCCPHGPLGCKMCCGSGVMRRCDVDWLPGYGDGDGDGDDDGDGGAWQ